MKKTKDIQLDSVPALHFLWFSLFFLCFIIYSMPCHAISDKYFTESKTDNHYCQPAEIDVNDRLVRAGLLYDISADAVVWEKNKDRTFPIASLTKMMVALIAMEDIFSGQVDMDTLVKVTRQASRIKGSKVHLRKGCRVSVEELLKAVLISSGNDASYLLAQFLGGTEYAFVQRMNKRAAQLGMKDTFYSNATGMPAPKSVNENRSSPSDLLILAREMLNYDQLLDIAGTSNTVITQDKRVIKLRNHNGLVATYSDVDGLKTGFTKNAKYCLVATANKSGRRLIAIALGVSDWKTRNQFVASTISRYYETLGIGGLEPKTTRYAAANCNKKKSSSTSASKKAYVSGFNAGASGLQRVKKGETLFKISKKYGCSVAELKSWNRLRGSIINPGQQLIILGDFHADSQTSRLRIVSFYKVRPGDTLWNISQKYEGISVKDIMKVNQIRRPRDLKAGTTLKIARYV